MVKRIFLLIMVCLIISGFKPLISQTQITVKPKEYQNALRNPMKGFRLNLIDAGNHNYKYTTIVRHYIKWNEIENNASDGVQKLIDYSNSKWSHLPELNVKVIPRVYVDWDKDSDNEYWPSDILTMTGMKSDDPDLWKSQIVKDRIEKLIYKMGVAWDNDPRVAWVQTGLIGYWGEQENPVGVDEEGYGALLGAAFDSAFHNKKLVVRNQNHWDSEGYYWGTYWDSYAHPVQYSVKTKIAELNTHGRYLTEIVEGEVAYNWGEEIFDPVFGGEPEITLNSTVYTNNMVDEIKELHCTGLGWISSYLDINSGVNVNLDSIHAHANLIQKAFGYRYLLTEFTCKSHVNKSELLNVSFKVKNAGSAPFYEDWPVVVVIIDEKTKQIAYQEIIPDIDIRRWLPGDKFNYHTRAYIQPASEYSIDASIFIPDNLPTGQYMIGISILEPFSMSPGIFFAIENFLAKSQTQPLMRIGIGENLNGDSFIAPEIFDDPLNDDKRYYTTEPVTSQ